jgi:hypothetical protein
MATTVGKGADATFSSMLAEVSVNRLFRGADATFSSMLCPGEEEKREGGGVL